MGHMATTEFVAMIKLHLERQDLVFAGSHALLFDLPGQDSCSNNRADALADVCSMQPCTL